MEQEALSRVHEEIGLEVLHKQLGFPLEMAREMFEGMDLNDRNGTVIDATMVESDIWACELVVQTINEIGRATSGTADYIPADEWEVAFVEAWGAALESVIVDIARNHLMTKDERDECDGLREGLLMEEVTAHVKEVVDWPNVEAILSVPL